MVKQRMTALDVRASVEEMRRELQGLRLLNIYDISSKMFLFKFGHGENKKTLLLESGVRMHLTQLVREKPKVPSQFTLKLRKHVRAWRLDAVTQLQHDRTVDFRFGVGEGASYHIIIELFSKGNVVLTDHEYRIMLLLRTHRDDDIRMFVRELYPVTKPFEQREAEQQQTEQRRTEALRQEWGAVFARHADYETTRSTLSAVHHFGPDLADHILTVTGVKNVKKGDMTCSGAEMFEQLLPGMLQAWDIAFSALPPGGYLIHNKNKQGKKRRGGANADQQQQQQQPQPQVEEGEPNAGGGAALQPQVVQYDDFSPVLLAQYRSDGVVTSYRDSFGGVCDAFFLYTETEKIEQHNEKKTTSVLSKREKFERDHQRRLTALEQDELENQRKGECIIQNADKIDEAIGLINGALAAGIQWDALRLLLKRRHAEGHPVAYMVHELFLERNSISVLLERGDQQEKEDEDEEREEDCDVAPCVIEVELSKTAYANAATYFSKKKANRLKHEKTIAATAKALAGAEKKGERLAAKQQTKKAIVKERHRLWWEKFTWFRTSCGDFVLQGKDAQTTEILVRRVMQLGDVFVHCDVDGAFPCVLRPVGSAWTTAFTAKEEDKGGPQEEQQQQQQQQQQQKRNEVTARTCPVHLTSLDEAGAWCVSRSSAWESKFSVGAWWVHASQIVGGTATGCYLFEGQKQYLRPQPLTLACGLLFRVTSRGIDPTDREELQNFVPEGERRPAEAEGGAFLLPDTATALHPLPSVEELRGPRRRPPFSLPPQQKQKEQKHQLEKQKQSGGEKDAPSAPSCASAARTTAAAESAAGGAKGGAAVAPGTKQLTKHQRKKLKKIQEKYKDQDEEDRLRGAFLNGNRLSKVQQEILALEREKAREKHQDPVLPTAGDKDHTNNNDEEEEEEDVEVVSHFDDEEREVDGHRSPSAGSNESQAEEQAAEQHEREGEAQPQQGKQKERANPSQSRAAPAAVEAARVANDAELRREWLHFTSRPQPTDHVEYAVAVCAPMSCVITYKYRAELSCGTAKKGQVVSSLQAHFAALTAGGENASEVQAVRSLESNDLMEQLRGNLKRLNTRQVK
ncbi:hypothetical protein DQ04_10941010 [Trypanosoma grayi]|uniref:hypothetical protein n=1 Tax=Trypanosoma grayi TaxID=71804 RepID=UPI0004F43335|nr:hypothetical protein DQ04_10941010 [Trypanosoma grayi]KEG07092.1 hypothetical protein DQ04_10941010 [Trypanosoma grayi]